MAKKQELAQNHAKATGYEGILSSSGAFWQGNLASKSLPREQNPSSGQRMKMAELFTGRPSWFGLSKYIRLKLA